MNSPQSTAAPRTLHRTARQVARLAAGLTGTALLLTASPALADSYAHTDPARDVKRSGIEEEVLHPAPSNAAVDVRQVRIRYDDDRLVIKVRTRAALPKRDYMVIGSIRTSRGNFEVLRSELFDMSSLTLSRANGKELECVGLDATIDRKKRTARLVIPAECLNSPRSVRVGLGVASLKGQNFFADDAFSRRMGDDFAYTPRIRRG